MQQCKDAVQYVIDIYAYARTKAKNWKKVIIIIVNLFLAFIMQPYDKIFSFAKKNKVLPFFLNFNLQFLSETMHFCETFKKFKRCIADMLHSITASVMH